MCAFINGLLITEEKRTPGAHGRGILRIQEVAAPISPLLALRFVAHYEDML